KGADCVDHDAAAAVIAREIVHSLPQRLDVGGVLSEKRMLQPHGVGVGSGSFDYRADHRRHAVDLGNSCEVLIRMNLDKAIVVRPIKGTAVPAGNPELDNFDIGDLHIFRDFPDCRWSVSSVSSKSVSDNA